jgi:hypothetical protein
MKKRILRWLFGNDLEEYIYVLHHWSKSVDGWGEAINIASDACARNERLIGITENVVNRYKNILHNAIIAYEFELEQQEYETEEELHAVVLNEFGMTDEEYKNIMEIK